MKKTMMKLLSVVMALMMLFGCFSTLISAASHEHDKMTKLETIAPRCNAYGYTLYICSCGMTWATDIVAKTEGIHSLEVDGTYETIKATAPTCDADGKKEAKACSWCGTILEGGEKSGDKTGHKEQWVLVKGDCTNDEKIVYKCINEGCDKAPTEVIELGGHTADGHNFVYNITKYPECKLEPVVGGLLSRVVNGVLVSGYTLTKSKGEAEYECLDCGVKYTGLVVEWSAHSFVNKTNGKVDNCTDYAASWTECYVCGLANNYATVDVITEHNYVVQEGATCVTDGSKKCTNPGCDSVVAIPATSHSTTYKCNVDASDCNDCTHAGRVLDCVNCTEESKAVFDEHAWGTKQYYSYIYYGEEKIAEYDGTTKFCSPVALYVYCTNPECDQRKQVGSVAADPASADHVKLSYIAGSDYFEAKCDSDGYIMVNCLYCLQSNIKLEGADAKKFIEDSIVEVEAALASGDLSTEETTRATEQLVTLNALKAKSFVKLGHNAQADCTKIPGYQATCTLEGLTDKYVCGRDGCTYVVTAAEKIPVDASKHFARSGSAGAYTFTDSLVKIGQTFPGTCTTPETSYYKCSECKHSVYVKGDFNYFNHTKYAINENTFTEITANTVSGAAALNSVAAVAVECGVSDGNFAYKTCKFCMNVVSVDGVDEKDTNTNGQRDPADGDEDTADDDIIYTLEDTVISKAHLYVDVEAQKETCTADGWYAYQDPCTRCGAASNLTKRIIPAHGDNYSVIIGAASAYAPECIKPGVAAGRYCAECDTKDGVAHTPKWDFVSNPDLKNPTSADPWYIAPLGHGSTQPHMVKLGAAELAKVTVFKGTCVPEAFGVRYCTYCVSDDSYDVLNQILLGDSSEKGKAVPADAWVLYNLVRAVDHIYPEAVFETDTSKGLVKNVTDNFTGVAGFDACITDKEYYVGCLACGDKKVVKTEAAKGHYYIENGQEVIIDITCTEIEKYADWACVKCSGVVGKDIVAKHSIVEVIEQPGCLAGEHGKRFWACELCDACYFADDQNPFATPSDNEALYVTTIPAPFTNHDFIAFATENGKLTEKYFKPATYTEDGYVYRVCSKCGIVKQTLSQLTPVLDITLKTEKATVASGDVFKVDITYVGQYVKFNAMQLDLFYDTDLVSFLKEDFNQELPAGVAVKEENNGKIVVSVYSLDGIEPTETQTISLYFRADSNFVKSSVLYISDAAVFDADGADISWDEVAFTIQCADAEVTSLVTGELNGYVGINAGDAIVMMDLIYAKQYNAQADLNKDGAVNVADFAILSKLIATDGSDAAYNKVIKEQVTAKYGYSYTRIS